MFLFKENKAVKPKASQHTNLSMLPFTLDKLFVWSDKYVLDAKSLEALINRFCGEKFMCVERLIGTE